MKSSTLSKEKNILEQIAKVSDAIREKHKSIKLGKDAADKVLNDTFKPVVVPLQQLVEQTAHTNTIKTKKRKKEEINDSKEKEVAIQYVRNSQAEKPVMDDIGPSEEVFSTPPESVVEDENLAEPYLRKFETKEGQTEFDLTTGVRLRNGEFFIGNSPIQFKNNAIIIGNNKYIQTPGLLELLFKTEPNTEIIAPNDNIVFAEIVQDTHLDRLYYNLNKRIRKGLSTKFDYFKKLIVGEGLPKYMITKNRRNIDYVYSDDPNELVDRLRLLYASQAAGNTSHNNEILSIIEELREAELIY